MSLSLAEFPQWYQHDTRARSRLCPAWWCPPYSLSILDSPKRLMRYAGVGEGWGVKGRPNAGAISHNGHVKTSHHSYVADGYSICVLPQSTWKESVNVSSPGITIAARTWEMVRIRSSTARPGLVYRPSGILAGPPLAFGRGAKKGGERERVECFKPFPTSLRPVFRSRCSPAYTRTLSS